MSPNDPARPALSRRLFLGRAAGAAALAPLAVQAASPSPDAALLALRPRLAEAERAWSSAAERLAAAEAAYAEAVPPVPEAIRVTAKDRTLYRLDWTRQRAMHGGRMLDGADILVRADLEDTLAVIDGRSRLARNLKPRLAALRAWEQAEEYARERASADSIIGAHAHAFAELERVAIAILGHPALTLPGLAVKARAILAVNKAYAGAEWAGDRHPSWATFKHGPAIAADLVAFASG